MEDLNNNITESEVNGAEAVSTPEKIEEPAVSDYIAPSEEEYKKAMQSSASKAKYALLQELGIKNVDQFKELKNTYDSAIKETEGLKSQLEASRNDYAKLQEDYSVMKAGVSDEYKEDFLTLVKSKVSAEKSFEVAAEEILAKNPHWRVSREVLKMGSDKNPEPTKESDSSEYLKKKYSWIK